MSDDELGKNLAPFCNTEVLQESITTLWHGISVICFFFRRKCRECMKKEERGVNDLNWFLWACKCNVFICRHYF